MNKFLQTESIEEYIKSNKSKKLASNSMDYENQLQFKNKSNKVDFNLNNINDETDDADYGDNIGTNNNGDTNPIIDNKQESIKKDKKIKKDDLNKQNILSVKKKKSTSNEPSVLSIEQLKQSNKSKSKRILRRIDKLKNKFNCTDQDALNLMIKNRKSNKIVHNNLSLENFLNKELELKNRLKVSFSFFKKFKMELFLTIYF